MTAAELVATAALEIDELTAGYDGAPVLRDPTVSVSPGEVVALIGANGAGKTTTLRAISGRVKPTAGRIALEAGTWPECLPPRGSGPASSTCPRTAGSSTA